MSHNQKLYNIGLNYTLPDVCQLEHCPASMLCYSSCKMNMYPSEDNPKCKSIKKLSEYLNSVKQSTRWMMDNVYVRQDPAGNIKMDKEKSSEKNDASVATVMAFDRAIRNQRSEGSVYGGMGIKLCQVIYVFFIDNVPIHRAS